MCCYWPRRSSGAPPVASTRPRGAGPASGGIAPARQELHESHTLAKAALEHLGAANHLVGHLCDLSRPKVEALVEPSDGLEDLLAGQVWVLERRDLDAVAAHERSVRPQPSVGHRLT